MTEATTDPAHALLVLRPMPAIGEVIANKYVLGPALGVGGMGIVHRAVQLTLDRSVAIKIVRPELSDSAYIRERFRHEALAASRAAHHNVIPIIDYDESRPTEPFLVMALVEGERLGKLHAETGPWSLHRVGALVVQVLDALAAMHAKRIVHGDVKADNVLVARVPTGEHATLIDFGLARLPDVPCETPRILSGTPEYLAPEIIRGETPTAASDLYGVGVMLYALLAGRTPFSSGDRQTVLSRQLDEPARPLSELCAAGAIPPELDRLVARALEKHPHERIAAAATFRSTLAAITMHRYEPVLELAPNARDLIETEPGASLERSVSGACCSRSRRSTKESEIERVPASSPKPV